MTLDDWLEQIRDFPEIRKPVRQLSRYGIEPKRVMELNDQRSSADEKGGADSRIEIWFTSLLGDFTVYDGQGTLEATFQPLEIGRDERTIYPQTYGGSWEELAEAMIRFLNVDRRRL